VIPTGLMGLLFPMGIAMSSMSASGPRAHVSGWIDFVPSPSLDHWTRVTIPPGRPLSSQSQWSVDAATHMPVCAGNGGHDWLRYGHKLTDFLFRVEWRLVAQPGIGNYNSGVLVRNNWKGVRPGTKRRSATPAAATGSAKAGPESGPTASISIPR
jgi:hypothetical protein